MKSIENSTSSPFKLTFQSSRGERGGAYENVPTTATYGSNEAIVAAIEGVGKIGGALVSNKMAKKNLEKANKKAKINKTTKKTEDKKPTKTETKASEDFSKAISSQVGGSLSEKQKKARGLSDVDFGVIGY
jgi:hypothetical protein